MIRIFILIILLTSFECFADISQNTKFVKSFDSWKVFTQTLNDNKTRCSIIANPILTTGFLGFRNIPYVGFSSFDNGEFSFSIYTGFSIDKNKPIKIFIDDHIFYLKFYRDFFAYTYSANDDVRLINAALINQSIMRVRIENTKNLVANDYYDLRGLKDGLQFLKDNYKCK